MSVCLRIRHSLLWWKWLRQRLAWEEIFTHGSVVNNRGDDGGGLHEVAGFCVVVNVHLGVMGASCVIERVLDELEARKSNGVEREMVGAAGVANRDRCGAEILEGSEPGLENGPHHVVALKVDAPNLS